MNDAIRSPLSSPGMQGNPSASQLGADNFSNSTGLLPKQRFANISETNSDGSARSDSSESRVIDDDDFNIEAQSDKEGKVLPRHANLSGSEAWYLKGRKLVA